MSINHYKAVFKILFLFASIMLFHGYADAISDKDAACDTVAEILRDVPGSVNVIIGKDNGCLVRMKGSWKAIKDDLFPPDLLNPDSESSALKKEGWNHDIRHDADGPDGTVFAIRKENVICIVTGRWDGGDDSDPAYIPDDGYEISVECGLDKD